MVGLFDRFKENKDEDDKYGGEMMQEKPVDDQKLFF